MEFSLPKILEFSLPYVNLETTPMEFSLPNKLEFSLPYVTYITNSLDFSLPHVTQQKKNKITPFENRISFEKNDKDITFDIFLKKEMDFQMKLERNLQDLNEVEEFRPLEMDETRTPTLKKV